MSAPQRTSSRRWIACSRCRRRRSARWPGPGTPPTALPCSRWTAATARAAGPSGRRASSSARRCCSSTPPASASFLELGRSRTVERMAPHLTHMGVHDHGFNNVSTYGTLLAARARGAHSRRASGRCASTSSRSRSAARCRRGAGRRSRTAASSTPSTARTRCSWTRSARCARSRSAHPLGHALMEEQDAQRQPARAPRRSTRGPPPRSTSTTAAAATRYDVRGRVAHESLFNVANGTYPRPEHAAGLLAVQHLDARPGLGDARLRRAARVPRDACRRRRSSVRRSRGGRGVDAGGGARDLRLLHRVGGGGGRRSLLGHRRARPRGARRLGQPGGRSRSTTTSRSTARPRRSRAQGLLRLGAVSASSGASDGDRYEQAGLLVLDTLLRRDGPYLSRDAAHQGLLLHSVYHWPNGWDHVPAGARDAARRVEPVGRLPRAGSGAVRPAPRAERRPTTRSSGRGEATHERRTPARRARHRRHARHRARHRAGARAGGLGPGPLRARGPRPRSQAVLEELRATGARRALLRRRTSARAEDRARLVDAARGRFGASERARQQRRAARRACAPTCSRPARRASRSCCGRICRARTSSPRRVARGHARAAAGGRRASRPRSSSSRRSRPTMASPNRGRILRQQGRPRRWPRGSSPCAWPRTAFRSTRCGRASSPPT